MRPLVDLDWVPCAALCQASKMADIVTALCQALAACSPFGLGPLHQITHHTCGKQAQLPSPVDNDDLLLPQDIRQTYQQHACKITPSSSSLLLYLFLYYLCVCV